MTNLTYRADAAAGRLARAPGPAGTVSHVARLTPIGAAVTAAGLARRGIEQRLRLPPGASGDPLPAADPPSPSTPPSSCPKRSIRR
jgi:hypothetical protein